MTLTRDVIKAAKDKNKLWDEIIQEICRWGEESVQNGERFEQLAELEEKYKKGLPVIEERVRERAESLRKTGREKLSEIEKEEKNIRQERERTLPPVLKDAALQISILEEDIRFFEESGNMREEEIRNRKIKITEIKRSCEKKAEIFENRLDKLENNRKQIEKEYLATGIEDKIRQDSFEEFQKRYETKKAALLSEEMKEKSKVLKKKMEKIKSELPPDNVRELCAALEQCNIAGVDAKKNHRYVMIGYRKWQKPSLEEDLERESRKVYSCILRDDRIQAPFSINLDSLQNVPVLVYQGHRDISFNQRFMTLCTAYCLTRLGEPIIILHTGNLKEGDILPEVYRSQKPAVFYEIPKGREAACVEKLVAFMQTVNRKIAQSGSENIMEYNQQHTEQPIAHCLLILDNLPKSFHEEEVGNLLTLFKEGGKSGIKVLAAMEFGELMRSQKKEFLELRQFLEVCGYGYNQEEKNFSSVGRDGEILDILSLESWSDGNCSFVPHHAVDKAVLYFNLPEYLKGSEAGERVVREEEDKSKFLRDFLEKGVRPKDIYFPAKIDGENVKVSENRGQCLKIWSSDRKRYENVIYYLLMQMILQNKNIYYFNFGENVMVDKNSESTCEFGLSCCDKLQYITPETLHTGLELCLQDLAKHSKAVWLIFSGMEYMDFYQGYDEEEREGIEESYRRLSQYLSTGDCHIFLGGSSLEACEKLKEVGSISAGRINLDENRIWLDKREGKLELWKPVGESDLKTFEEYIQK